MSRFRAVPFLTVSLALASVALGAWAQTGEVLSRSELRVCADPNNLPFSNEQEQGFENKIAHVVGAELNLPVSYFWFPQVMGFVRNTLQARNCDLVIGTIAGGDIMQTTNPYYYSTYVMVVRSDRKDSLSGIDDPKLKNMRIGIIAATPPTDLLVRHGLIANVKPYALMVDTRYESPTRQMIEDIVKGDVDVGLLWGPIAGFYAKHENMPLTIMALKNEPGAPRMDYRVAMGVRANEPEWRRRINAVIVKRRPEITAILQDYGVPLLDERGQLTD